MLKADWSSMGLEEQALYLEQDMPLAEQAFADLYNSFLDPAKQIKDRLQTKALPQLHYIRRIFHCPPPPNILHPLAQQAHRWGASGGALPDQQRGKWIWIVGNFARGASGLAGR